MIVMIQDLYGQGVRMARKRWCFVNAITMYTELCD